MALPKRLYTVRIRRDGLVVRYEGYALLKDALSVADLKKGEKFSYRIYEGGNSVECEWLGGGKFRERRK